ncbi:MAG: SCO family protein [Actinomycetes bacterium]
MRLRVFALVVVAVLALAACGAPVPTSQLQGVTIENPVPKPSFTLTDMYGEPYDFAAETEGKVALLFFGYTYCPDICPTHMAQVSEVLEQYPDLARKVQLVFVSVDPDRDTPERLQQWVGGFHPSFVGLTGTPGELEAAQKAANVPVAYKEGEEENYTVAHAGWVIAYAPDGLSYSIYPNGTRQTQWVNDLKILAEME